MLNEKEFLENVKNHELHILLDNGVYRHLKFKATETSDRYFELITTPGRLFCVGDMGDYAFERLPDMFNFFRTEPIGSIQLPINTGYWAEKLIMVSKYGGASVFDEDGMRLYIKERGVEWMREAGNKEERRSIKDGIKDLIEQIECANDENEAYVAMSDFNEVGLCFEMCDINGFEKPNGHFLWCLYAITWGIRQYDKQICKHPIEKRIMDLETCKTRCECGKHFD